eukprot:13898313-Heterocapsa_arctica.AAC.1
MPGRAPSLEKGRKSGNANRATTRASCSQPYGRANDKQRTDNRFVERSPPPCPRAELWPSV